MNACSRITTVVFVLSFLLMTLVSAQPPDILWSKFYGGSAEDNGRAVCRADNGYMVTGYGASFGAGGDDIYLMKIDEDGDTLWFKTYGGGANERAFSIEPKPRDTLNSPDIFSFNSTIISFLEESPPAAC